MRRIRLESFQRNPLKFLATEGFYFYNEIIMSQTDNIGQIKEFTKKPKRFLLTGSIIVGLLIISLIVSFVISIKRIDPKHHVWSVTGCLHTIRSAEGMYKAQYKTYGTLMDLGRAGYIDNTLATGKYYDCNFVCIADNLSCNPSRASG